MNIENLIPSPDSIPVPWGWFWLFLMITFFLHLLLLNVTIGTGIISLVKSIRGKENDLKTAKDLGVKLPYAIAFTITTGVAPLLFIQVLYGHFIYTSSVLMASYWLSIIALLLMAYYSAYIYDFKFDALGSSRSIFIAVSVIIFLIVAFFFSNNMTLMLMPEAWKAYFSNSRGTILNLYEPTLYPRYLHFLFASIANGGLFLALLNDFRSRKGNNDSRGNILLGLKWFTFAFIIQILIGFWFFLMLPKEIRILFMGQNFYATTVFILGILSAFTTLILSLKKQVRLCTIMVLFTITNMVLIRDVVRTAYLKPYFSVSSLKVYPQYSPMILFIIVLTAGIGIVVYMLKLASRAGKEV
ncbi:MAG: hypothetical protein JRJ39_05145 [Deltaproteobacteria bacterium]|nr:hypothetical protein [Deltaproteobacteria bacterium]MBW2364003.1 hypothetical protein [Deltaproteobacteria bacterium]